MSTTVLLLAALLLTACSGGGGGGQSGNGGQQGGGPPGAVLVNETEWVISLPAQIPSGPVTFSVKNNGAVEHNFVIQEANLRLDGIQPGQSKTLSANLRPGSYNIVCDIAGHSEAGMKTTVRVQ
ncbi:MAG: cupredoxin domain-containing protein [bacterium]